LCRVKTLSKHSGKQNFKHGISAGMTALKTGQAECDGHAQARASDINQGYKFYIFQVFIFKKLFSINYITIYLFFDSRKHHIEVHFHDNGK